MIKKFLNPKFALPIILYLFSSPFLFAQGAAGSFTTVGSLISTFTATVVRSVGTLFIALAVVAFLYGIVQYIWGLREGKADKIKDGNTFMVWGLVALFVMFSIYGIISLAQGVLFNGKLNTDIIIPEVKLSPKTGASFSSPPSTKQGQNLQVCTPNAACEVGRVIKLPGQCNSAGTECIQNSSPDGRGAPTQGQAGSSCTIQGTGQAGQVGTDGVCRSTSRGTVNSSGRPKTGSGGSCIITAACQDGLFCVSGICLGAGASCVISGSNGRVGASGVCYAGGTR